MQIRIEKGSNVVQNNRIKSVLLKNVTVFAISTFFLLNTDITVQRLSIDIALLTIVNSLK